MLSLLMVADPERISITKVGKLAGCWLAPGEPPAADRQVDSLETGTDWDNGHWVPAIDTLTRWISDIELGKPASKALVTHPYTSHIELNARTQWAPLLLCYWFLYQRIGFSPNLSADMAVKHYRWNEVAFPSLRWREIMSYLRATECEGCEHLRMKRIIFDIYSEDDSVFDSSVFALEECIPDPVDELLSLG